MHPILKTALLITSLTLSSIVDAAFVDSDWLAQGDAKATLHTDTGLEWLKLTETNGKSVSQVLNDPQFDGWRMASYEEVLFMTNSVFPDYGDTSLSKESNYFNTAARYISQWEVIFGKTTIERSYGLHMNQQSNEVLLTGSYQKNDDLRLFKNYGYPEYSLHYTHTAYGVFLVSDGGTSLSSQLDPSMNINNPNAPINASINDVSGPFALGAFALCLIGLSRCKKDGLKGR